LGKIAGSILNEFIMQVSS